MRLSVVLIFLLHLVAVVYTPYLHGDVAQYLTAGQMLVQGAVPYVDIVDTNPPMIIYISSIPAAISYLFHLPLAITGLIFFFALILFCIYISGKILKHLIPDLTRQHIQFFYIGLFFASLWSYHKIDFAEREQLIFYFFIPFIMVRHARYIQISLPLLLVAVVSFLAFCGVAMKPFYILPLLANEIIHIFAYRKVPRPFFSFELTAVFFLCILYLSHFYFFPGMSSFYDYWLDFTGRGYSAYEVGWRKIYYELLLKPYITAYFIAALFLFSISFFDKNKGSLSSLTSVFGAYSLCTLPIYLLSAKGWAYQLMPFYLAIFTGAALFGILVWKSLPLPKKGSLFSFVMPVLSIFIVASSHPDVPFLWHVSRNFPPFSFQENILSEIIKSKTAPEDRVLFLNTSMNPAFPALTYTGRQHGGRFLCTYPLAFFFKNSSDYVLEEKWRDDEKKFFEMLVADIYTLKPKLIFINTEENRQGAASYFKISEYLKRKNFYRNVLSAYNKIDQQMGFEIYQSR